MTDTNLQTSLIATRTLQLRPWMPPTWRDALAGNTVNLHIPSSVRQRYRRPKRIKPSEHSELYRRMPSADAHPGPWRIEFARQAVKVMDTWAQPWVREVWFCGVDQMSKTNTMISCIYWSVEHAPGNIFYQMPDEASSNKIMEQKINAGLKESPHMARYLSPRADDTGLSKTALTNGVTIIPAWSGSPSSTAIFSALYTFTDELDKCKMVGKEASPIDRIKKRTRTKRFGKHFFSSTPAGLWVHAGTMDCAQVWTLGSRCPECRQLITMDEEHIIIPEGATLETLQANPDSVHYACNSCGTVWDETTRARAFEHCDWVCIKGNTLSKPETVGFLGTAFPLPDVPMVDIAKIILRAKAGDMSAKRDLAHSIKAQNYTENLSDRKEDAILRLRDHRPAGVVPTEADGLEISIDTQDNGFWYRIRAWRYGLDLKSWLVKAGFVPSNNPADFTALDELIAAEYPDENGEPHRIMVGIIDSQGHRTSEVYAWCKRTGVLPAKGAQGRKTQPVTSNNMQHFPGTGRQIPGGLRLYHIDTHFHKDALANKLLIDPSDPGALVLHSGYTWDQTKTLQRDPSLKLAHNLEEYARQMCVEGVDERGLWQNPNKKANHLWDCESNGLALVMYLGWQHKKPQQAPEQPQKKQQPPPTSARSLPAWFRS